MTTAKKVTKQVMTTAKKLLPTPRFADDVLQREAEWITELAEH